MSTTSLCVVASIFTVAAVTSGCGIGPYTSKEMRCGEVYGHDNHAPIHDVDDCLGLDDELRSDGQFKNDKDHCATVPPKRAAADERCRERDAPT